MEYEQMSLQLDEKYIVVQDNRMIMAKYDMSALEQKLFLILVSTIKKDDTVFKETSFKVTELAELMGVSPDNLYRDLKKLASSLVDKKIEIEKHDGGWLIAPLMKYAEYKKNEGIITLCLNDKLEPYFLQLKKFFTSFNLNNALNLSGKYSIRVYQLSKSNLYKNEFVMTLDEFREELKLKSKSYEEYKFIKSKILTPSAKEINEKTDIAVDVESIKEGRSVKYLKFTVKDKVNYTQLENSENKKGKKNKFQSYNQRNYNMDKLEENLLGWETCNDLNELYK